MELGGIGLTLVGIFIVLAGIVRALPLMPHRLSYELENLQDSATDPLLRVFRTREVTEITGNTGSIGGFGPSSIASRPRTHSSPLYRGAPGR